MKYIDYKKVKQKYLRQLNIRTQFKNIFTNRIHPAMSIYAAGIGVYQYGIIAEDGLYQSMLSNEYFAIYRDSLFLVKEVRYSKTSPIYYELKSSFTEAYFRDNGTICLNSEIATYTLKDKKGKKFVVDWVCQTVIKQKGKGKLKPGKYSLSIYDRFLKLEPSRYITIEPNGKFKITFE